MRAWQGHLCVCPRPTWLREGTSPDSSCRCPANYGDNLRALHVLRASNSLAALLYVLLSSVLGHPWSSCTFSPADLIHAHSFNYYNLIIPYSCLCNPCSAPDLEVPHPRWPAAPAIEASHSHGGPISLPLFLNIQSLST